MTLSNVCQQCDENANGKCAICHGLGYTLTESCVACHGTGRCANCDGTGQDSVGFYNIFGSIWELIKDAFRRD